jgi:hypothetical protein
MSDPTHEIDLLLLEEITNPRGFQTHGRASALQALVHATSADGFGGNVHP